MSAVGTLVSICHGGGLVTALVVLVAIDTEGVKKKNRKLTSWAR